MYTPKFSGQRPGFDSKYDQLTSITIQTDPRQRTSGPAPTPWLVRSPEVPDTLSLARPADHGGARSEKSLAATIGRPKLLSKDGFRTHKRDQRKKMGRCCRIRFASNLKMEWVPTGEVR